MSEKKVYVTTDYREKQLQRALLQYSKPENANLVREALRKAGREDLIGNAPGCLVKQAFGQGGRSMYTPRNSKSPAKRPAKKLERPSKKPSARTKKSRNDTRVLTKATKSAALYGKKQKRK